VLEFAGRLRSVGSGKQDERADPLIPVDLAALLVCPRLGLHFRVEPLHVLLAVVADIPAAHRLPTRCGLPCPSAQRPVASFEGAPSLFFHRSMTPHVPGVRWIAVAGSLQSAHSFSCELSSKALWLVPPVGLEPTLDGF
jgi:hypothetical protein